ncbi:MAG: rhodanese-like domain-containing protein [Verrucomicrobiales bacterium]|nr:rhodanese-like domain-containing protein [Verrucomicrobiales bacterium]
MIGKQIAAILGISLVAAILSAAIHPLRPPFFQVESAEVLRWQIDVEKANQLAAAGEVLWVDARSREKFEEGHLEGAILLNPEEWGDLMFRNMDALQAALGTPVVVYCDGTRCEKSQDVSARLRELLGLDPVYVLKGDWREIK